MRNTRITKMGKRRIAIVVIVAALVGMLVCAGLLIQAYITQKPLLELLVVTYTVKPGFELLGYSSEVFYIAGYLALIIALNTSTIFGTQRKQLGYISASIGAVLLFLSFGLLFVSHKPELEWWGYFYTVASGTGLVTIIFSTLIGTEQKRLSSILLYITMLLVLAGLVLTFLDLPNEDAIAVSAASLG